jgi:hypothetical protein
MPAKLAETLGLTESVRSIPIVEPAVTHAIGLVVPDRQLASRWSGALDEAWRSRGRSPSQPGKGELTAGDEDLYHATDRHIDFAGCSVLKACEDVADGGSMIGSRRLPMASGRRDRRSSASGRTAAAILLASGGVRLRAGAGKSRDRIGVEPVPRRSPRRVHLLP